MGGWFAYKSDGNTAWTIVSDRRLKDRIVPLGGPEEILALAGALYYKDNATFGLVSEDEHIGVIAQEVQKKF